MMDELRAAELAEALAPELKLLAKQIHDDPKLGGQELKACAWQVELLNKYGFTVEGDFCGLTTAYRASYQGRKQGAKIAFMAEYPDPLGGLHTPEMVAAPASEYVMENALNFVKGLSLTAAELMAHSEHLLRIQI